MTSPTRTRRPLNRAPRSTRSSRRPATAGRPREAAGGELFDRTDTVQVDGAFYEVSETRVESSEATIYSVNVAFNPDDTKAEVGEVAYDDLPAFDREQLSFIVDDREPADEEGYNVNVEYGTARRSATGRRSSPNRSTTSSPTRGTATGSRSSHGRSRRASTATR